MTPEKVEWLERTDQESYRAVQNEQDLVDMGFRLLYHHTRPNQAGNGMIIGRYDDYAAFNDSSETDTGHIMIVNREGNLKAQHSSTKYLGV